MGRNGEEGTEDGTDGGMEELLEEEKDVAGEIFLRSTLHDWGAVQRTYQWEFYIMFIHIEGK